MSWWYMHIIRRYIHVTCTHYQKRMLYAYISTIWIFSVLKKSAFFHDFDVYDVLICYLPCSFTWILWPWMLRSMACSFGICRCHSFFIYFVKFFAECILKLFFILFFLSFSVTWRRGEWMSCSAYRGWCTTFLFFLTHFGSSPNVVPTCLLPTTS